MERPTPTDVEHEVTSVDMIVSKSDETGNITYTNPIFMKAVSTGSLLKLELQKTRTVHSETMSQRVNVSLKVQKRLLAVCTQNCWK
jgi:hypothetical protein